MNYRFVGLDLSLTGTGMCLMEVDETGKLVNMTVKEIKTKPVDFTNSIRRVDHISEKVLEFINSQSVPEMICVEDYFTGKNPKVIIQLCELGTMVRFKLIKAGLPFYTASPNSLKKFCLGKGAGGKELIIKGVYKKYDFDTNSNNIADAVVLAHIAKSVSFTKNNRPLSLAKYESEVVEQIIKDRVIFL